MASLRSRHAAPAALIGGLIWCVSWSLNGQTAEGNRRVLGFTEGNYRAMLNPAFLLLLVSLAVLFRLHRHRIGRWGQIAFAVVGFGLLTFVVGNVLEFGLLGNSTLFGDPGWLTVVFSLLVQVVGYIFMGLTMTQARVLPPWSRVVPVIMGGLLSTMFFNVMPIIPIFGFGIGWIVLGLGLWSMKQSPTAHDSVRGEEVSLPT